MTNRLIKKIGLPLALLPAFAFAQEPKFEEPIVGKDNPQLIDDYSAFISLAGTASALASRPDASADNYFNGILGTTGESYTGAIQVLAEFLRYRENINREEIAKICTRFQNAEDFRSIDFFNALKERDEEAHRKAVTFVKENLRIQLGDERFAGLMSVLETNIKSTITLREVKVTDEMASHIPTEVLLKTYCMK
jgi:hypothetical protein